MSYWITYLFLSDSTHLSSESPNHSYISSYYLVYLHTPCISSTLLQNQEDVVSSQSPFISE